MLDRNPVRLAVTHLGRIRSLVHRVQEAGLTRWWWVGLKGVATPWLSRCDGHAFIYVFYIILLTHSNRKWPPSEFDDRNSGLSLNKKAKKGIEDPSSVVIYSLGRSNWASWERSYTTVTRSRAPSRSPDLEAIAQVTCWSLPSLSLRDQTLSIVTNNGSGELGAGSTRDHSLYTFRGWLDE